MKMLTVFCFLILSFCAQAQLVEQNGELWIKADEPRYVDCIMRNESKSVRPMFGVEADITHYVVEGVNIDSGRLEKVASYRFVHKHREYYTERMANRDARKQKDKKNKFKQTIKANCQNASRFLFLNRKWI